MTNSFRFFQSVFFLSVFFQSVFFLNVFFQSVFFQGVFFLNVFFLSVFFFLNVFFQSVFFPTELIKWNIGIVKEEMVAGCSYSRVTSPPSFYWGWTCNFPLSNFTRCVRACVQFSSFWFYCFQFSLGPNGFKWTVRLCVQKKLTERGSPQSIKIKCFPLQDFLFRIDLVIFHYLMSQSPLRASRWPYFINQAQNFTFLTDSENIREGGRLPLDLFIGPR